jgi:sugar O-acyltransferase (sialic acid O-acetyltransferase NeuD family)
MSKMSLVILGAGGHGKVCAEIAFSKGCYDSISFSDDGMDRGTQILQWKVGYHDADLLQLDRVTTEFIIGMGQITSGTARERLYLWLQNRDIKIATLISSTALVSPSASIGMGTVVGHMALVQTSASISQNCIINSRALVEHDSSVGNHVHLATGSILNGNTTIGDRCLVGSGAIVNNGIKICSDTIIGAGAVVIEDIDQPGVYVGVPARKISHV